MLKVSKILLGLGMVALLAGCGGGNNGNADKGDNGDGTSGDSGSGGASHKTLTINTPLPGLTVSLHDPDNHFKKLETKTTGSDGSVNFDVDSDTVTASVSYSTKIEITPDLIFQAKKPQLTDRASWNCQYGDLNMSECKNADWCAIQENNTTIPAWIVDAVFAGSDEYNITAANTDTNKDGKISVDEFYEAAKTMYDKDKNDAITLQELQESENTQVHSKLFVNVPVKTYKFTIGYFRMLAWYAHYYGNVCSDETNTFDLNLTHARDIGELKVMGSNGWNGVGGWSDPSDTRSVKVEIGQADNKGKYDYLIIMKDENYTTAHTEVLLDQTKGDLQDGVTYDVSTLGAPSMREVTVMKDVNNSDLYVDGVYNGMWLDHTEWGDEDANKSVFKQYYNDKLTYPIDVRVGREDGNVSMDYWAYNGYYGDGKLKTAYKTSDYPMLDVTVSFAGDGVQFDGSETGKIDISSLVSKSHFDNNSSYEVTVVGTGALQIKGADIKPANLLPSGVSSLMSGDQNITHLFAAASEDKTSTGIEIFKKGLKESSSNPRRSVGADKHIRSGGTGTSSSRGKVYGSPKKSDTKKRKPKRKALPIDNPFVIDLGAK